MLTATRRCLFLVSFSVPLCVAVVSGNASEPPRFRTHTIDATSEFAACAAIDVNDDGKLDIVSGGFWYEAPSWKKHFLRDVQVIRGRFDDYSHLPMDVNGDGRVDYVSANYRSESIYWVENAGAEATPWKKHVVDTPGPMETAILVDVDGDGRNDVLPNGKDFAAWWELLPSTEAGAMPKWVRHDLPSEAAGHGVGFGDVNGDGRGDIVGARGWLEAPEDRREGRWVFHREFSLDSDCSIPMLVVDVDRDGDNDLVWGRGHKFGVYWLEQLHKDGERQWLRHAIDSEWSQGHSAYWADMNGDGNEDLVTGKRYLGHDGKDPGAYDPLVFYWYEFSTETRSWTRHPISVGERVGTGLDLKIIDLDSDGDLDVITSDKCGVYLCENLSVGWAEPTNSNREQAHAKDGGQSPPYENHQQVMMYKDVSGEHLPVKTLADLCTRRQHILQGMQAAMGELPETSRRVPLDVEVLEEIESDKYTRKRISFTAEPGDRVPAFLLIPHDLKGKAAAMLCLHQTTGIGKGEPAGLGGKPTLHYAHELAERGFVCIVPDYPSFGDYPYDFKTQGKHYASGSMKAIWNNLRAVDLLVSLPEVDSDRIGCIGHSLGGHNSLFTAAFDQRLKAVVTSCGFTAFHHYYEGKLAGWTSDRYMPRIRDLYENDPDQVPFDFYEVLAAICPRSIFINAPLHDSNFDVTGVRKVVEEVGKAYDLVSLRENVVAKYPDSAHDFPDAVRQEAYAWLKSELK